MQQSKMTTKSKERPLHLLIKIKDKKVLYVIDDYKSIHIMWSDLSQSYLISFKQYRKELVVSAKHFNITGRCFDEVY